MPVSDIMTENPLAISPDHTVGQVYSIFQKSPIHHLLVVEKKKLVGVVSDRDVLRNISPFANTKVASKKDLFTLERTVRQIMLLAPATVSETENIQGAAKLLLDNKVDLLPVTNSAGEPVGVLSWKDVMRYIIDLH